jgi:hypothetical protein
LKALFAAALQFDENSHQMRSRFSDNLNDTSAATEEAAEFRAEERASNRLFTNQPLIHQATPHKPWAKIAVRIFGVFALKWRFGPAPTRRP